MEDITPRSITRIDPEDEEAMEEFQKLPHYPGHTGQLHPADADAEELMEIKRTLYSTDWISESRQIIEIVTPSERDLLNKCINQEPATNQDINGIEAILGKYREAIRKLEPEQTLQNLEDNILFVQDQKKIVEILKENNQHATKKLNMYYPLHNNKKLLLELEVLPLTDADAVLDLQKNLSLFKDLTDQEKIIYEKEQTGAPLSREEQAVSELIKQKIEKRSTENTDEVLNEFLSHQTRLRDADSTKEDMLNIYSSFEFSYKALLFSKVQELCGLDEASEADVNNLFREVY